MKYIKTFENLEKTLYKRCDVLTSVCYYFIDIIPITVEEGFTDCLYDDSEGYRKEYFTFYFKDWTDEEIYYKFEEWLKSLNLKIKAERITSDIQIDVKVSDLKIKKFVNLYNTVILPSKKYNL